MMQRLPPVLCRVNMQAVTSRQAHRAVAGRNRQHLCWQGWRIEVPTRWNPVKLEGTFEEGYVLLADLHRPRLGLRWTSGRRVSKDPQAWAKKLMHDEVGQLAAAQAVDHPMPEHWTVSRLFIEPEPPGRDVWLGYSTISGRAVQLTHHAHRRERVLAEVLLPTLEDQAELDPRPWSVLDLSCRVPRNLMLQKPLLFAGDLGLRFVDKKQQVTVRQVAPASVALKRMPIERWLRQQQISERKHYRPAREHEPVVLTTEDGRQLKGVCAILPRRRRFIWKRTLLKEMMTYALHDEARDRLVMVQGGGVGLDLPAIARSVGL